MTKTVYDIKITEGEDAGYFRMMGISDRENAENIQREYWPEGTVIVEREVIDGSVSFDDLY